MNLLIEDASGNDYFQFVCFFFCITQKFALSTFIFHKVALIDFDGCVVFQYFTYI